jgi:diguanylate cyclase (GGDEF)-like protein/PAS domain S-box-containing protein
LIYSTLQVMKQSYKLLDKGVIFRSSDDEQTKRLNLPTLDIAKYINKITDSRICGIFMWQKGNTITFANNEFLHMFGYTEEDVLRYGLTLDALYGEKYPDIEKGIIEELISSGVTKPKEKQLVKKDGSPIDVFIGSMFLDNNSHTGISFVFDVSKSKVSQRALDESIEKLNALSKNSYETTTLTNKKGKILFAARGIQTVLGYTNTEMIKENLYTLIHDDDISRVKESLNLLYQKPFESIQLEYRVKHKNGSWRWIECTSNNLLKEPKIRAIVSNYHDITERKDTEKKIHRLAFYDQLTGLPNRLLFRDRLEQALKWTKGNNEKVAVLHIDLDRFKNINDALGHETGDKILIESSERIKSCIKDTDTLSRQGGDEFTIVLANIQDIQDIVATAQKITAVLSQDFKFTEESVYITPSIGVSIYPDDTTNADQLLTFADTAMYISKKHHGGNTYNFYNSEMSKTNREFAELENSIRNAILRNEFVVFYQPKIDLESGEIVGMEALIRWNHPTLGLIPPMKFIPVAEETGLIGVIGEQTLHTACKQTKQWQLQWNKNLCVAVNVSIKQLRKNFVKRVQNILESTGLEPQYLELEITETDVMLDNGTVQSVLKELKAMGIRISVDDFGTGYSSLSRIGSLPIDSLKIDKSFIDRVNVKEKNSAIIKAIIGIAKSMKLEVIAEGVETDLQMQFLKKHKCNQIQGYFISPPVSEQEFGKLILARNAQINY